MESEERNITSKNDRADQQQDGGEGTKGVVGVPAESESLWSSKSDRLLLLLLAKFGAEMSDHGIV